MLLRLVFRATLFVFTVSLVVPSASEAQSTPDTTRFSVLVFSKTEGYRHESIASGKRAIQELGDSHDFRVDTTEDASVFAPNDLAAYDAVVFLNTSGDVLDATQEEAFENYIRAGNGYVGIHGAAATEYDWEWYGGLVGAFFDDHPDVQPGTVTVSDPTHPATRSLPVRWNRTDEWYNYRSNPRGSVHVLATLDEQSYEGGTMGSDHPIAWVHKYDGGRSFYTGGGHRSENFADPQFRHHLLGGIEWAVGAAEGSAAATVNSSYEKVVLDSTTTDPMDLAVAPDGRVFYIERRGVIRVWDPDTRARTLAGYLPVSMNNEDGLLGVALAPSFPETGWIYMYYSPTEGPPRNQLSRFTVEGNQVDLESETTILEVRTQREECCHTGGSIAFGPDGETLYLSTGDDTNPFASSGYAPIDERPDRQYWDAQRTSANTQDLRGKILRINPRPDGGYTVPEGNLFPDSTRGRPEIYVMGLRNPYRISVDDSTGWLYWGDIGPDAAGADSARGPAGHDEFNQARAAGNYGWPYFVGNNKPYGDYDFAADTTGRTFDPKAPINDSPNNTGARELPPAQPPIIWYPYGPSDEFPEMGAGSRSAMVGPVYHYDSSSVGDHGLPSYFDGSLLIYEWGRNWIKEVVFDSTGHPAAINPLFTDKSFIRPMDVEVGPEGRLYVLQWGNNFGGGPNSEIVRLDYHGTPERPPDAQARASTTSGPVPLDVTFRANPNQADSTAEIQSFTWTFDGTDRAVHEGRDITHQFDEPGRYTAHLTVMDTDGRTATDSVSVVAGNTAPSVSIQWPRPGGVIPFDTSIPYRVTISDSEDDSIAEDRVDVHAFLGRDSHELPVHRSTGTEGTFTITRTEHYDPKERLFAAFEAQYTDAGGRGVGPLQGQSYILLHPQHMEAEFATLSGPERETLETDEENSERRVITVENGHTISYPSVNLRNVTGMTFELAPMAGGRIEVRHEAPDGPVLAETTVPAAPRDTTARDTSQQERDYSPLGKSASDWQSINVSLSDSEGPARLYLVFHGHEGLPLFRLDGFQFHGPGMSEAPSR